MNEGTIKKQGSIIATPTKEDRSVKIDFGGYTEWFPLEIFTRCRFTPVRGARISVEFATRVRSIRKAV